MGSLNFVSFYISYHDKLFSRETKIREYKVFPLLPRALLPISLKSIPREDKTTS